MREWEIAEQDQSGDISSRCRGQRRTLGEMPLTQAGGNSHIFLFLKF